MGGFAANILAAALEAGDEPPQGALIEIWPICKPYFEAWVQLEKSRNWAVGMSAVIPLGLQYSEVVAYAKENGFGDPDELQLFVEMVYVLDSAYLKHAREKK